LQLLFRFCSKPQWLCSDTREGGLHGDKLRRAEWKIANLRISGQNGAEVKLPRCPGKMIIAGQPWVWGAMP